MENFEEKTIKIINTTILSLVVIFGMNFVYAWNGPISNPPQGNAYAPINTTATSQTKQGSIWASGFFTTGGGYFGGDVGIGTSAPEARLDVRSGSCWYQFQTAGLFTNCSINTPTLLTISSDTANYNIATALENPTSAKNVILTINSGVTVYSTSASSPALDTGTLPSGSTVKIVNSGTIIGAGGAGGNGGSNGAPNGGSGGNGGNSINIQLSVTIDNTNGNIFGAGGTGGGGGASTYAGGLSGAGGGGGGGGAGTACGAGGTGGTGDPYNGAAGTMGCSTSGAGGAGGIGFGGNGGNGGSGGDYGVPGNSGQNGTGNAPVGSGGSGGAAGQAVKLNSNSVTWLGGNNGTQVKGVVQ